MPKTQRQIGIYFGLLLLCNGLGDPTGFVHLPVLFLLKDHLHLGPESVAVFEAITLLPHYFALLFGLLRDWKSPFGYGDRGYLLLAAPVAIVCYAWLATGPTSYGRLLAAILVAMAAYQMMDVSIQALMTMVAQRDALTGKMSAFSEALETIIIMASVLAGGWMAARAAPSTVFWIATLFSVLILAQGFWRPAAGLLPESRTRTNGDKWRPLSRLVAHRAVWPTVAILLLYNFSPGWGTPFFYFLTDKVGISSEVFGLCKAVQYGSTLFVTAIYGILCRRLALRQLLWWAVLLNVFPGFLFLLIHGAPLAVMVSAFVGVFAGFANVTLFDLLMRSCPKDLEGTSSMLYISAFGLAGAAGDLLGAWLYGSGGFTLCLALDALATALIFPLIGRLPRELISTRDGEQIETSASGAKQSEAVFEY